MLRDGHQSAVDELVHEVVAKLAAHDDPRVRIAGRPEDFQTHRLNGIGRVTRGVHVEDHAGVRTANLEHNFLDSSWQSAQPSRSESIRDAVNVWGGDSRGTVRTT